MGNLVVSFITAFAMAVSIYTESSSILLAFLAYSLTGTCVLLSVLLTEAVADQRENQLSTTE